MGGKLTESKYLEVESILTLNLARVVSPIGRRRVKRTRESIYHCIWITGLM